MKENRLRSARLPRDASNKPWATEVIHFGRIVTRINGVRYYEAGGRLIAGGRLTFKREPRNRHDKNAIAAYDSSGRKVGYIAAPIAAVLSPLIKAGTATLTDAAVSAPANG